MMEYFILPYVNSSIHILDPGGCISLSMKAAVESLFKVTYEFFLFQLMLIPPKFNKNILNVALTSLTNNIFFPTMI